MVVHRFRGWGLEGKGVRCGAVLHGACHPHLLRLEGTQRTSRLSSITMASPSAWTQAGGGGITSDGGYLRRSTKAN